MISEHVTPAQRRAVHTRAEGRCEYCRTPDSFVPGSFAVEHILPRAKGGKTHLQNLALSCPACNRRKTDTVLARDPGRKEVVPIFHPRRQVWSEHFIWAPDQVTLVGLTETGRATITVLALNRERVVAIRVAD